MFLLFFAMITPKHLKFSNYLILKSHKKNTFVKKEKD